MRNFFFFSAIAALGGSAHRVWLGAPAPLEARDASLLRGQWDEAVVNLSVPLRRIGNTFASVEEYEPAEDACQFRDRDLPPTQIPLSFRSQYSEAAGYQLANCLKTFMFWTPGTFNPLQNDEFVYYEATNGISLYFPFGFYSDDPKIRGLSHLVEHMLFLGSKRYPFDKALDPVTSEVNGLTGNRMTQYFVEVDDSSVFPEAILRLGDAVTNPLLQSDMVLREVASINSEFAKHAADDVVRLKRLIMALTDKDFPGRDAHWGNAKSLIEGSGGDPEALARLASEFHRRWYTANGANMAMVGRRSVVRMKDFATKAFSGLPAVEIQQPWAESSTCGHPPHTLPKRVSEGASSAQNVLVLQFPIHINDTVTMRQFQMLNPFPYLALSDKREGSFFHEVDKRGWIRNLVYSAQPIGEIFTVAMALSLTEDGFNNRYELMEQFFSYKQALRDRGVDLVKAQEMQRMRELQFQFTPPERPLQLAQRVAAAMSTGVRPAFWLSTAVAAPDGLEVGTDRARNDFDMLHKRRLFQTDLGRVPDIFLNKTVAEVRLANAERHKNAAVNAEEVGLDVLSLADTILDLVSPTNMIMIERDVKFAKEANDSNYEGWTKDSFFDMHYKMSDVPEEWMKRLLAPPTWPSLPVSVPNPNIPHVVGPRPFVILSKEVSRDGLWQSFVHKVNPPTNPLTRFQLEILTTEMPPQSPTNLILLELISQMLKSRCDHDPDLQPFIEAGYRCALTEVSPFRVWLELRGMVVGIQDFVDAVLHSFMTFKPRAQDLMYGEREVRKKYYSIQRSVHEQALMNALSAVDDYRLSQWEVEEVDTSAYRMQALYRDIVGVIFSTRGSGLTWWKKIYTYFFNVKLPALLRLRAYGRYSLEDIEELRATISKRIPTTPASHRAADARFSHLRQLPRGVRTLRVTSLSDRDFSYGLAYMIQFAASSSAGIHRAHTICNVVKRELRNEYYRDLRTRQQLGYIVEMHARTDGGIPALMFNIQSEVANPRQLRAATESFLVRFHMHVLPKMEKAVLTRYGKVYGWPAEDGPTHDDVSEFFMAHILPDAMERHVLASEVWPKGKAPPPAAGEMVYDYPRDLKKDLPHTMRFG
eukprot:Polyplicarium_translucidae@DN2778_c0_g1_i2.p1